MIQKKTNSKIIFDYVIPFNDDYQRLFDTIKNIRLNKKLYNIKNIIISHNGNLLDPKEFKQIISFLEFDEYFLHTDYKGIGAGYKKGIKFSSADYLVLSASDLPLEFSDISEFLKLKFIPDLAIGSKAHSESQLYGVPFLRRLSTYCFYQLRRIIVDKNTPKDTQGTIIIKTELAKKILQLNLSDGFAFSMEMITYAGCFKDIKITEVPIVYYYKSSPSSVSIPKHSFQLFLETIKLRIKVKKFKKLNH